MTQKKKEPLNKVSLESLREKELSEMLWEDSSDEYNDWPVDEELDFSKDPVTSYWPDYDDFEP